MSSALRLSTTAPPRVSLNEFLKFTDDVLSDSIRQASKEIVARPEGTRSFSFPARVAGFKKTHTPLGVFLMAA